MISLCRAYTRYAQKLLESVATLSVSPLSWSEEEIVGLECMVEKRWRAVVVFFVLRLALAPCVEAMVLVDRKTFLLEQGQ